MVAMEFSTWHFNAGVSLDLHAWGCERLGVKITDIHAPVFSRVHMVLLL